MQLERSCLGRTFLLGCGLAIVLAGLGVGGALYLYRNASETPPEPRPEASAAALTKRDALEQSLAERRAFEAEFSADELTALAQDYLQREGIEGDVRVELPEQDFELTFRTTTEQLTQLFRNTELPTREGSDVRGSARFRLRVAEGEAFAGITGLSLYGLPLPLSLLGIAPEDNLLDELDEEGRDVVARIRSLTIRDETLYLATE